MKNFFRILLPGVLIPMCLGTVYNFSQYVGDIQECFNIIKTYADFGFTAIIFCLGFGAAIFGRSVELNPKKMATLAAILFILGTFGLSLSTHLTVLPLYYVSCALVGTGTGIGYVSPIKQLMSTYKNHKRTCFWTSYIWIWTWKVRSSSNLRAIVNKLFITCYFLVYGFYIRCDHACQLVVVQA